MAISTQAKPSRDNHKRPYYSNNSKQKNIKLGVELGHSSLRTRRLELESIFCIELLSLNENTIININTIYGPECSTFHSGISGTYQFYNMLGIQFNLVYIPAVTITSIEEIAPSLQALTPESTIKARLHCLQTSMLLDVYPGQSKQFFISLGPYFAYIMAYTTHITTDTKANFLRLELDKTTDKTNFLLKKVDYGFIVKVGYYFNIGLTIYGKYDKGLDEGRTNGFHMGLGYNLVKLL
ncbi:MAG: outer membrane beta-barrel protein [Candidatus Amoebophilus sp.]